MIETFLYVEDQLIDLYPNTLVSYTYQNTLLSSLDKRNVSYTNRFKVPDTENNALVFGFPALEKAKQSFVKRRAKIVQDGVELVTNGLAFVKATKGYYEIEVYDGIITFIEALGDGTIDELYEIDTTFTTWSAATIDSKRAAISGLVAPVLSYGQLIRHPELPGFADWTQLDSSGSDNWTYSSNTISTELASGANEDRANLYAVAYKLYPGYTYTISTSINRQGSDWPYLLRLYGLKTDQIVNGVVDIGVLTTPLDEITPSGTPPQSVSFTFTTTSGYDYIAIDTYTIVNNADIVVSDMTLSVALRIGDIYYPSVYYKSIISAIISSAGYTSDGINYDFYSNIIIPFCKDDFKFTGLFNNCREFKARRTGNQTISVSGNFVIFDEIVKKDLYGFYDSSTGGYSPDNAYQSVISPTGDVRQFYSRFYTNLKLIANGDVEVQLYSQALGVLESSLVSDGVYKVSLAVNNVGSDDRGYNIDLEDTVVVRIVLTGGATTTILEGEFYNVVDGTNQQAVSPTFYPCEILPEIYQKDFFKDFCIRFGVVPREKNKYLYFKTFEEIIQDKGSSKDWTDKRDLSQQEEIIFNETFAQNNRLLYKLNDLYFSNYAGGGNIDIDNEQIKVESTFYESIFEGSIDIGIQNGSDNLYIGYIPLIEEIPSDYLEAGISGVGNRIMGIRSKLTSEPSVEYNSTSRTDYKVANFLVPGQGFMSYQQFIESNYKSLRNALQQNKIIIRFYNLNTYDITSVNQHTLIYDDGSYFLINKISNFIPGKVTKVELFKVQ